MLPMLGVQQWSHLTQQLLCAPLLQAKRSGWLVHGAPWACRGSKALVTRCTTVAGWGDHVHNGSQLPAHLNVGTLRSSGCSTSSATFQLAPTLVCSNKSRHHGCASKQGQQVQSVTQAASTCHSSLPSAENAVSSPRLLRKTARAAAGDRYHNQLAGCPPP